MERIPGWPSKGNPNKRPQTIGNRLTTFFLEKLPKVYKEEQLWRIFQRWGKDWEIYISPRWSVGGNKFGIIQYLDARDVKQLESQLNTVIFGNVKIRANVAKYPIRDRERKEILGKTVTHLMTLRKQEAEFHGDKEAGCKVCRSSED
ncbi:hypothetical protein Fmac_032524 [Flemingia macrophylla]|uniref:RRM domain-containing protein n=1 Tax=Flemingia macrophylla TaxID=520843 RepID=A0ABD1L5K7_9FABA